MVEVTIGGCGQLQGSEADVIKSLIVNAVGLICVLYQLVDREGGVVGLHNCVRHLRRRHHAEGVHDAIRVLLADFADEQGAHAGASTTTQGVSKLKALQAITALSLFPHYVQDGVHKLGSLSVVALCPVVSSSTLACSQEYHN